MNKDPETEVAEAMADDDIVTYFGEYADAPE